eukprot:gene11235-1871_t
MPDAEGRAALEARWTVRPGDHDGEDPQRPLEWMLQSVGRTAGPWMLQSVGRTAGPWMLQSVGRTAGPWMLQSVGRTAGPWESYNAAVRLWFDGHPEAAHAAASSVEAAAPPGVVRPALTRLRRRIAGGEPHLKQRGRLEEQRAREAEQERIRLGEWERNQREVSAKVDKRRQRR